MVSEDIYSNENYIVILLACINKSKGIIDIYDWFYDKKQEKHVSYHLSHVQLDMYIDNCVFETGMHIYKSNMKRSCIL